MVVNKLKVIDLKLDLDENEIVLWSLSFALALSSCTPSSNVTDNHDKVGTCRNGHIRALTLNGHTYYWKNHWFAHAGDCKKCKHELDSIVKAAVKEAMQCE